MDSALFLERPHLQRLGAQLRIRLWVPRDHSKVVKPTASYPHNLLSCLTPRVSLRELSLSHLIISSPALQRASLQYFSHARSRQLTVDAITCRIGLDADWHGIAGMRFHVNAFMMRQHCYIFCTLVICSGPVQSLSGYLGMLQATSFGLMIAKALGFATIL